MFVSAGTWTYEVSRDTGTRIHLLLTNPATGEEVVVKAWLNRSGALKTKVIED